MTKSYAGAFLLALVAVHVHAEPDPEPPKPKKAGIAPVRSLLKVHLPPVYDTRRLTPVVTGPLVLVEKVRPKARLTNRWCFVVDNSDSMRGVFGLAISGYQHVTRFPMDDFKFCVFSFSDKGQEKFLGWQDASPKSFKHAENWLWRNRGTYSHGSDSVSKALRLKVKKLTVFLITDGGFTSACTTPPNFRTVRTAIKGGQAWRKKRGLPGALIVTIGIENKHYTLANKPPDRVCQAFLRGVGRKGGGGAYLIRRLQAAERTVQKKRTGPW